MNLTRACCLSILVGLFLSGCATIDDGYRSYDPSRRYLHTEQYFSAPIEVPPTLSSNKMEEYYPVPEVAGKSSDDKPALLPPSNTIKGEHSLADEEVVEPVVKKNTA